MSTTCSPFKGRLRSALYFLPTRSGKSQFKTLKVTINVPRLKGTAMRRGGAWHLRWTDVDLQNNAVKCNKPEKNSNPRIFKISNQLTAMLDGLKRRNEYVFGGCATSAIAATFAKQRNNIARKLKN